MVLALLVGLLSAVGVTTLATLPAQAAPGDPFDGTDPTVFIAQGPGDGPTRLYKAVTGGDGVTSFQPEGPDAPLRYNAIGYREADHYLYGFVATELGSGIPQGALIRIGEAGAVQRVGTQTFGSEILLAAAFGSDGLLYASSYVGTTMYVIDVSSGTLVRTVPMSQSLSDGAGGADFTYADGYFWSLGPDNLLRLHPDTGQLDVWNLQLGAAGGSGAAWTYGNGNLGFSNNEGGDIIQIQVTDPGAANPGFTVVSRAPGPPAVNNDGASSMGAPTDLALTKTGPATVAPGGQISYGLTVTNNGPGNSAGWVVRDEVPAGLTDIQASGSANCVVEGQLVTCTGGQLANGASAQLTITATVAGDFAGCVTNNGTVLAHQEDPNPGNNQSSVTSCAPALDITKSSNASADSRPGDSVTYTVTATNNSQADFTADVPAVVADDMTGALDDATYNNDAVASRGGPPSYSAPNLVWSGELPAGESVTITYTMTLVAGGNGVVRNVAWAPPIGTPPGQLPPTPACDPPDGNGNDPATGLPCAEVEYLLPKLTIAKTTDKTELPAVGEELTYTVTVTNSGPGAYTDAAPATFTDDLSDVLQDATFNDGSVTASAGTASYSAPNVNWSGPLASGASATITYTVTYNGEGDQRLDNQACVPDSEVAAGAAPCATVSVPGALLTQSKTSEPSSDPLVTGSTVLYTLTFENSGQAAATVNSVDHLVYVLDDASLVDGPTAGDGLTAMVNGEQIDITGSVPPGESRTVTYTVQVHPDDQRGDNRLVNHLMNQGQEPPGPPDTTQPCEQTTTSTCHDIAQLAYGKSVEADTDPVETGTVLTFAVTIENIGHIVAPVAREDVLTDVLDDATLLTEPTSDHDAITVSAVENDRFSITGELPVGESVTITYQVTVNDEDNRGNNLVGNHVVPPGTDPPAECTDTATSTCTPLPNIAGTKSSDPVSETVLEAGDTVAYTLTFTNNGEAAGPVRYRDLLEGVLDDADVTEEPVASDPALTVSRDGALLDVGGTLEPGQTATVTFAVAVKPVGQRGDNQLWNFLLRVPPGEEPPTEPPAECDPEQPTQTCHPLAEVRDRKTVEPSSTPVQAGVVLTYTVYFENLGTGAGSVDRIDDITGILDDADVTVEPASEGLTVTRDGAIITITGELEPGASAEVTYQVTIRGDDERGDSLAANFVLDPGQEPPEICQPADTEWPDCTLTPIGSYVTSKSVSASDDSIVTGTVLTYTLTFDNQSPGAATVDNWDVLTDASDDATLVGEPSVSDDSLSVSDVSEDGFRITGEIASGATIQVTYEMEVKPEEERGNNSADNFLVPTDPENPGGPPETPGECAPDDLNATCTPLPNVTGAKSADPASGSVVEAGDEVTYTLEFTNSGLATGVVDYVDHMAGVLDDATLVDGPTASTEALSVSSPDGGVLSISGLLEAGESATVTYTVQVNPEDERGDSQLENFLVRTGTPPPTECTEDEVNCTYHPMPQVTGLKSSDPVSGTSVTAGEQIVYTLTFTNGGTAPGAVDMVDNLDHVLDDATLVDGPDTSDAALSATFDGDRIVITGELAPEQTETVTYTVQVKEADERGDNLLANYLLPPDGEVPGEPECPMDRDNATCHPIVDLLAVKSSDPESGTELVAGDDVVYTLSFTNNGEGTATVEYTDHLADVFDDAELVDGPTASGDLEVSGPSGDQLVVTGTVESGATERVVFTVRVLPDGERGNDWLGNFLAPTGEEPPSECVGPETRLCTFHDVVTGGGDGPGGDLPDTGGPVLPLLLAAMLALSVGMALVWSRRRTHQGDNLPLEGLL